jgi:amino acid transporter
MSTPADLPVTSGLAETKKLSTPRIVFLVVAAAAPLAAMVGNVPLALKLGNGPGLPGAFVLATGVLFCFAVGYAAMSRKVVNTGAFYTYVARGLGKPPAVSAAFVAVLSYNALAAGLVGAFGYFGALVLDGAGVHGVPWYAVAAVGWAVTAVLGYRSVDVSARVLAVLMVAEISILLVLDLGVLHAKGTAGLPTTVFAPSTVFSGALGLALMFAFASFIGFESAALYGEESHDPQRTIPRATYASVLLIGTFYTFTTWCIVGGGGVAEAQSRHKDDLGTLVLDLNGRFVGQWAHDLMAVFFVTSVLASLLAIHNAASRYMFALGREHVLPSALGRFHPRRYSPYVASMTQSGVNAVIVTAFAVAGLDPYLSLAASMVGISTLGIVLLQAAAAIAIVAFFRRRHEGDLWRTVVAPLIGAAGLIVAATLLMVNYSTLTGTRSWAVNGLPVLLVLVAAGGMVFALWLRRARPAVYRELAGTDLRRSSVRTASVVTYGPEDRYCIVGGGPAGLVMARAFDHEGVGYDLFERHFALGGIWDMANEGTPMYESAHFISSKYTSHFYGFPMPADYPDYPSREQILAYVRAFASGYGLDRNATTGVAVVSAAPVTDGWEVLLSTGERRRYRGVVCANGVTWHPRVPELVGLERYTGEVRHSVTYRSADELRGRRVLVVGAGNSGVDIACDAARSADAAFLSVRRGYRFVPKHIFGIPTDVFITRGGIPPKGVVVPEDPSALVDSLVGDLTRFGLPAPDHALLESHPIMNTQVLHYLAHGDLAARPDVRELREHSVVFADGTQEDVDLVLLATGYDYLIPYVDPSLFVWKDGRPDLFANIAHRTLDGLYVLGFVEFADAAYQRFDEMAQVVVIDAHAHRTGEHLEELRRLRREGRPDLTGGHHYVDSPRHAAYVDSPTYQRYLAELRDRFGFADPDDSFYGPPDLDLTARPDSARAGRVQS